jgi:hypothetical protein
MKNVFLDSLAKHGATRTYFIAYTDDAPECTERPKLDTFTCDARLLLESIPSAFRIAKNLSRFVNVGEIKVACKCGKLFEPSGGEFTRCADCMEMPHDC